MDFGLGLILSFTDRATAGINNAVNSLNTLTHTAEDASESLRQMASLSAISVVAMQVGSTLRNAGTSILSIFSQIIGKVNETGTTLMYAERQLDALYAKSGKTGAEVIDQIQDYAKHSMFEFENLIPAVTSLKSVGIEAFDAITSSTGNAQHSLLDYASALASFAPQMHNAYGTGINAAIGAMREYIAEGNALSLKRGAGLDITGILGEDKGATIEERTRQIADLIETLGMMPMVEAMSNSAQTKLSNMGDTLFEFLGLVSKSGVYDAYVRIIDIFAKFVESLDGRLPQLAETVGSALTMLMKPIEKLAEWVVSLANAFVTLIELNPFLAKIITIATAMAGVLLVLGGVIITFTGAISLLRISFKAFKLIMSSVGGVVKSTALKVKGALLPLTATLGLMFLAWKTDFLGIRTLVTNFASNIVKSFRLARSTVEGNVTNMVDTLNRLERKDDFFSNLTMGVIKLKTTLDILSDAWGDFTLSEDNYLKAKELGILPLIEAILDLKYRFDFFKDGFISGWNNIKEAVIRAVTGFTSKIKGVKMFEPMVNALTEFFKVLSSGDPEAWYKLGESFAQIATVAGGVILAFKVITGLIAVFTKVWGIVTAVVGAISAIIGAIGALPFAIIVALGVAIAFIIRFKDQIAQFFVELWNSIKEVFSNIGSWFSEKFTLAVEAIKNAFSTVGDFFRGVWNNIKEIFSNVGNTIATSIKQVVTSAINFVLSKAVSLINGFISAINGAISIINAIPGVNISRIKKLAVPQLAMGGVVDKPTMSLIGEAGAEAVVPLENNLGWINKLASEISHELRPSHTGHMNSDNSGGQEYITSSNNTSHTYQGDTDNSIVFNEGAIQIAVQNATEEEAIKLAKKIMEYIKRQRELDKMLRYA